MARLNEKQPLNLQMFLKGLPQDVDEGDLTGYLSRYGNVKRVFVVKHKLTGMPTGSAFVHFENGEGPVALMDQATQNSREVATDMRDDQKTATEGLSRHKAKELIHKLKHQQTVARDPFIHYGQTRVTVLNPMTRTDAQEFIGAMHKGGKKTKRTPVGADDPRNLYLLREGLIEAGTPAAKGLSVHHLQALIRDYEERKAQLKNVNFFVSKTRLSIRNLPRSVDDAALRKLVLEKAKEFYKKNPTLLDKSKWGKHGPLKQCRVMVDTHGQSKRFGFVELIDHEVALYCLRLMNNNPELFGESNRPVVNFAVENANAIQKMARLRDVRAQRAAARAGDDAAEGAAPAPQSYREMAMKARTQMDSRRISDGPRGRRSAPAGKRKPARKGGYRG
jgi:nucleolar protein 4